jgi:hypothetical protein
MIKTMAVIRQYASRVSEAIFVIQELERAVAARTKEKEGFASPVRASPIPTAS